MKMFFIALVLLSAPYAHNAYAADPQIQQCLVDARVLKFLTSINDREKNRPAKLEVLNIEKRSSIGAFNNCNLSVGSVPDVIIYSHSRRALNKLVAGTRVQLEYYLMQTQTPTGPISTETWTLVTDEAFD